MEMYIDDGITIDEIDAVSGTLTVGKINSKIDGTNTRSIIHFTKYSISSGFDDLDIDIKLKGKTDPQTTIYDVVYGVEGTVNDVDVKIWDRFYYYTSSHLNYEVPIDTQNKQIINLANGTNNKHAVNKQQLDNLMKLYYYNPNLTFSKTKVIFKKINITTLNISKGIYLITYFLPINISSNYDSKGIIQLNTSGLNNVYNHNILQKISTNLLNTNIYIINQSDKMTITLRGSGLEFNQGITDKYLTIYKLFDQLP